MFKYDLGQEVVFGGGILPAMRQGIIIEKTINTGQFVGEYPTIFYTIKRGNDTYYNIPEKNILFETNIFIADSVPNPKFQVGEKVRHAMIIGYISSYRWSDGIWYYNIRSDNDSTILNNAKEYNIQSHEIKLYKPCLVPNPKFQIGDKVRIKWTTINDGTIKLWKWVDGRYLYKVSYHQRINFIDYHRCEIDVEECNIQSLENKVTNADFSSNEEPFGISEELMKRMRDIKPPKIMTITTNPSEPNLFRDIWNEARLQKPYNTGTYPHQRCILGIRDINGLTYKEENRKNIPQQYSNWRKTGEKEMKTGIPFSVNFVEKKNRTTLVWKNNFKYYHYDFKDTYETTTSTAHKEKFNKLYGFLMAYFKRVHKDWTKTRTKKYLETFLYTQKKDGQIGYLTSIFVENCGLTQNEITYYLKHFELPKKEVKTK